MKFENRFNRKNINFQNRFKQKKYIKFCKVLTLKLVNYYCHNI